MADGPGIWPIGCFGEAGVLVTGGTSGIGAGIAAAFLKEGAREAMPGVTAVTLDVRDAAAVAALIARFDTLSHVVNCAGVIRRGDELDPAVFADVVDINLNGAMRVSTAARPLLARNGGTITAMASMLSYFGGALVPGYAASKGGIVQMTKSLALAYAADGIRVNAVAPGWIDTPLTRVLREDPERDAAILGRTALKRWGKPSDLAGAVLFLASPLAAYITGTVLPVDGGYLAA
jgi:NAD(P)-dependent dehydrogenase (short-subunit alcohol dehydrogenase family)